MLFGDGARHVKKIRLFVVQCEAAHSLFESEVSKSRQFGLKLESGEAMSLLGIIPDGHGLLASSLLGKWKLNHLPGVCTNAYASAVASVVAVIGVPCPAWASDGVSGGSAIAEGVSRSQGAGDLSCGMGSLRRETL